MTTPGLTPVLFLYQKKSWSNLETNVTASPN